MLSRFRCAALSSAALLFSQSGATAGQADAVTTPMVMPETVVITASPFALNPLDVAASVTAVPHDVLIKSGGFGIGDALKDVPGVVTSGYSAGSSRPIIRGLSSSRVKITENGIGGHDTSDSGDDHAVPIDALSSLQVEVLRGPATLRYGSQAIGGVVNAINNRIPIDLGEGVNVESFASVSSNSVERVGGMLFDAREGNWAFHADGLLRGADAYSTALGKQLNSFAFGRGASAGGAYIANNGSAVGLSFNQYIAHYGAPFEPGSDSFAHVYLDSKNYNGAARWNAPVPGITRINFNGGYTDYFHDEVEDTAGPVAHFSNREWEGRVEALHQPFGPIAAGALGFQFDNRNFAVSGAELDYLHPTKNRTFAGYLFEDAALSDNFNVQGAVRVESASISGHTDALGFFDRSFTPVSASGSAIYKPMEHLSAFVNVSRTERAPGLVELFAQGPHDTSKTFEFGDPNLRKEAAFSVEGGLKYQGEDGSTASISFYRTRFNGFIDGFLTGNSRDDDGTFHPGDTGEFRELVYLQRDATFRGFEAQVHWHVADLRMGRLGIDAQADHVRATLDDLGNVPRIPPLRYGGGLFFESTMMELTANFLRVEAQNRLGPGETPTSGYTTVGASATFHVYRGDAGDFDIALIGSNLTDSIQRNHVSFVKDFWVQPGRTFRLVLHYLH